MVIWNSKFIEVMLSFGIGSIRILIGISRREREQQIYPDYIKNIVQATEELKNYKRKISFRVWGT